MKKSIDTIRLLGLDMVDEANSGHPGIVLGAAPIMYQLFNHHLTAHPDNPQWFNRDRFVMSSGHGSALFYSLLHLSGFALSIDDLKGFRRYQSLTPGHPEYRHTAGVDATTGPLGQGISMAVGMAIAEEHLRAKFNEPEYAIIDHYTYVFTSDGDLQEGVAMEALALAGHYKLGRLIMLYDSNDTQLNGPTSEVSSTNIKALAKAFNLEYLHVSDANDTKALDDAIRQAKTTEQPTLIEIKSILAYGSIKAGDSSAHGAPIGREETERLRALWLGDIPRFHVTKDVYDDFRNHFQMRGQRAYNQWQDTWSKYQKVHPEKARQLTRIIDQTDHEGVMAHLSEPAFDGYEATRVSAGKIIQEISQHMTSFIGGSADLSSSTRVKGTDGRFSAQHRLGRDLDFGVREHAMGAIINGLTLHHLRGFSGGFFTFSDYMKPAIRLAALMGIPSIFIFTHDSIGIGEDGPTHQPVEQLSQFRAMPNCVTLRPADAFETKIAFEIALNARTHPTIIVLSRQNLPSLPIQNRTGVLEGAYVVSEETEAEGVLFASGSEVSLALAVAKELKENHQRFVDVVSVPSLDLFLAQPYETKEFILKSHLPNRMAIEMGSPDAWYQLVDHVYGQQQFGLSGKGEDIMKHFGFTKENIVKVYLNRFNKP